MIRLIGQLLQIYGAAAMVVATSLVLKATPMMMFLAGVTAITIGVLMRAGIPNPNEREEI